MLLALLAAHLGAQVNWKSLLIFDFSGQKSPSNRRSRGITYEQLDDIPMSRLPYSALRISKRVRINFSQSTDMLETKHINLPEDDVMSPDVGLPYTLSNPSSYTVNGEGSSWA